jgi:hypothetical protein
MIWRIQIIVIQKGDEPAARQGNAMIVRSRLIAASAGKIDKLNSGVIKGRNTLCRIVRAGIPDDNQLPFRQRRIKDALDCMPKRIASIVGCDDNGNDGSCCGQGSYPS